MKVRKLKPDELQHHGIKGQKWGVRRFQNYDGTLINSKGQKGQYGGSGAGVNDPRAKHRNDGGQYSTGKSKGVHRRGEGLGTGPVGNSGKSRTDGEYAKWLKSQHSKNKTEFGTSDVLGSDLADLVITSEDLHGIRHVTSGCRININPNLSSNQIGCVITKSPSGYDIYNLEFKDVESCSKFLKSESGDAIMSSPTALAALGEQAYQKGYLEYDENFANSAQGGTAPFASFNNLSDEEQLDPTLTEKDKKPISEEEYNKIRNENGLKPLNGKFELVDQTISQVQSQYPNAGQIVEKKKYTAGDIIKTAAKELVKAVSDKSVWTTGALSALGKAYIKANAAISNAENQGPTVVQANKKK